MATPGRSRTECLCGHGLGSCPACLPLVTTGRACCPPLHAGCPSPRLSFSFQNCRVFSKSGSEAPGPTPGTRGASAPSALREGLGRNKALALSLDPPTHHHAHTPRALSGLRAKRQQGCDAPSPHRCPWAPRQMGFATPGHLGSELHPPTLDLSCIHVLQSQGNSYTPRCPSLLPEVPQGGCQGAGSFWGMGAWAFRRAAHPAAYGPPHTPPGQRLAAHGCTHSHPLQEGAVGFLGVGGSPSCAPRQGNAGERDNTVLGAHRAPPTQRAGPGIALLVGFYNILV